MLAKYIPGGVWTPAARVVALRRHGVRDTPVVLATILLEAGLSAIAGVVVFVVGLVMIGGADAPLLPLGAFAVMVAFLLYPPVFRGSRSGCCGRSVPRRSRRCRRGRRSSCSGSTRSRGRSAAPRSSSSCARSGETRSDRDSVPRRCERGRGDRRRARGLRALRPRRPRGIGVRADPHDRLGGSRARHDLLNRLAITVVEAGLLLVGLLFLRRQPAPADPEPEVPGRVTEASRGSRLARQFSDGSSGIVARSARSPP